jgi:ornithine cyclodeaminase
VTRAREPFLVASMVARGAHINAVGAIVQAGAEVAPDVIARCTRIAADSPASARRLSRELIDVFGDDDAAWTRVERLADVIAANDARSASDDLTLFKSLGMGISDLSLGIEVHRAAVRAGMGRPFAKPEPAQPVLIS